VGNRFSHSGSYVGQKIRRFEVEEDATIFGALRAIDKGFELAVQWKRDHPTSGWVINEDYPVDITPNAAELGWPLGAA
jgi:hypothetical protein